VLSPLCNLQNTIIKVSVFRCQVSVNRGQKTDVRCKPESRAAHRGRQLRSAQWPTLRYRDAVSYELSGGLRFSMTSTRTRTKFYSPYRTRPCTCPCTRHRHRHRLPSNNASLEALEDRRIGKGGFILDLSFSGMSCPPGTLNCRFSA